LTREELLTALLAVRLAAGQQSRAIGQAKKAGQDLAPLLAERKRLGDEERRLQAQLDALAQPDQPPHATDLPAPGLHVSGLHASAAPDSAADATPVSTRLASEADFADWDAFVAGHPEGLLYHRSTWRRVIQSAFGHDCPYLVALRGAQVVGVLPLVRQQSRLFGHFMVSIPFFNYGGVLAADAPARDALLAHAARLAASHGCSHIELRDLQPLADWPARTDKVSMWLQLPPTAEQLWSQLGSKLRAQIKKAQASGLVCETGGIELLDDFYRVFATNMRDLGTPVYAKSFFAVVLREAPGQPRLVLARTAGGQAVSAALLVEHGGRMEVPWASTLRSANHLNANMGLYWHMLQHAVSRGCTTFDFGRSTLDAPTFRFKKQWGAQPVPLFWHYWLAGGGALPKLNPDNPKFKAAIAIWQRLPVWLTRLIGPLVVKHLP
jgi:FemAB-related protein (PEP-CTERM system-associated)